MYFIHTFHPSPYCASRAVVATKRLITGLHVVSHRARQNVPLLVNLPDPTISSSQCIHFPNISRIEAFVKKNSFPVRFSTDMWHLLDSGCNSLRYLFFIFHLMCRSEFRLGLRRRLSDCTALKGRASGTGLRRMTIARVQVQVNDRTDLFDSWTHFPCMAEVAPPADNGAPPRNTQWLRSEASV